jgi:hypothetical protein
VPGQEVVLVRRRGDAAEQVRATTGSDGGFQFSQVALEDSASLALTTSYLGVPYVVSDVAVRAGAESGLEVAVYDTTSSDAAVRADAYHLLVNAHGPALEVLEILSLRNEGDRTIYGADGLSLRVPLPSGFTGLEVEAAPTAPLSSGFASRWPVPPGPARLRFRYRLPAGETFSRPAPYPASMVSVLIHPSNLSVESSALHNHGPVDFEGQKFLHLMGSNVSRGTPIDFRVTGGVAGEEGHSDHDHARASGLPKDTLKWGLLGLAVRLGTLAVFYRPGKKAGVADRQDRRDESGSTAIHRRVEVIRQIADLDDEHEAGRIDEAAYQKRRSDLKDEAVRLTEALRQGDG